MVKPNDHKIVGSVPGLNFILSHMKVRVGKEFHIGKEEKLRTVDKNSKKNISAQYERVFANRSYPKME